MTDEQENPQAFPRFSPDNEAKGMTLRDYFAGQAIPALIARHRAAMLAERAKGKTNA